MKLKYRILQSDRKFRNFVALLIDSIYLSLFIYFFFAFFVISQPLHLHSIIGSNHIFTELDFLKFFFFSFQYVHLFFCRAHHHELTALFTTDTDLSKDTHNIWIIYFIINELTDFQNLCNIFPFSNSQRTQTLKWELITNLNFVFLRDFFKDDTMNQRIANSKNSDIFDIEVKK